MGTRKSTAARILTLACAGLFCLGASFTWTGNGTGDAWDTCGNWDACSSLFAPYPQTANDVAIIPDDGIQYPNAWEIRLVEEEIEDLKILEDVRFLPKANELNPVLECDEVIITAGFDPVHASVGGSTTVRIFTS